ncbi:MULTISPECIES: 3-hydroxyacyl-CoA dehydrogenase NAD-binding domain-containing protein [Sphingobium]|uniref:3-hydroxyacyl-CoA dehydrogenase NAD-binding domain-containing protein n=1 Tax=Sphingobium TaxID=165695 RepID=UPI00159C9789|nr:3-hydroxyacyl-CoA dehydrogenase NAD-binding domain-containing protein [Sphingobium sp. 15-1]
MNGFIYEKDADGIVTVTMDMFDQSANTMGAAYNVGMTETLDRLEREAGLSGVIFASAKKTFFAGGDLKEMLKGGKTPEQEFEKVQTAKSFLRRLERLPVPVAAAINGAALGGGFEIALACNYRVALNSPKTLVGLPEVTLGLIPGAGGVVRMVALLGLEKALPLLLEGTTMPAAKAYKIGIVDALVDTAEELIPAAKQWIKANPEAATQPWDRRGFAYPGGNADSNAVRQIAAIAPTMLIAKTRGLMPAPAAILDVAVNSMRMGFDSALKTESRAFVKLVRSPEARAQITAFFLNMNGIKNGANRPQGEQATFASSAVLGAGMMGQGIAWAHASRNLPVALKDLSVEAAEKGKAYSAKIADGRIRKGRMSEADKGALLGRITPTGDYADMQGVDIVIEAVFEDIALKEKIIAETFGSLSDRGIYGTNTSTIPVGLLAKAVPDPSRFIGIHFFSPVDKMQLVEIIRGEQTSDATAAAAYDYVKQIGKIPIVVNDSRGFFTSRVFGTFTDEGAALIRDGVAPVQIEREAWKAGMPVGPLAVADETSILLMSKVLSTHGRIDEMLGVANGYPADMDATRAVSFDILAQGRGGRQYGGGFYTYHDDGSKSLWEGLSAYASGDGSVPGQDIRDRLLFRQSIETLRCYQEGVLRSEAEANIGSIFAFGFPAHTGGALQFIDWYGRAAFLNRAAALADRYGERFRVTDAMAAMVASEMTRAA